MGAYKRMVKYESVQQWRSGGAARRLLPLNFAWPWFERLGGDRGLSQISNSLALALALLRARESDIQDRGSTILVRVGHSVAARLRSGCGGSWNPVLPPNRDYLCCLYIYTWTWRPFQPAACIYVTVSGKRVHSAQNVHSSYKRL